MSDQHAKTATLTEIELHVAKEVRARGLDLVLTARQQSLIDWGKGGGHLHHVLLAILDNAMSDHERPRDAVGHDEITHRSLVDGKVSGHTRRRESAALVTTRGHGGTIFAATRSRIYRDRSIFAIRSC